MKCGIIYASNFEVLTNESKFIEINDLNELKNLPERFIKLNNEFSWDSPKDGYSIILDFNHPIYCNDGVKRKIIDKCLCVTIYDYYIE